MKYSQTKESLRELLLMELVNGVMGMISIKMLNFLL